MKIYYITLYLVYENLYQCENIYQCTSTASDERIHEFYCEKHVFQPDLFQLFIFNSLLPASSLSGKSNGY